MTIDMSQFYEVFFDESDELLAVAERLLLDVNIENPDSEDLNAIFRAAHSIKGGAATFGFMDMTEITHVLENLLDRIRKNEMKLTAEHVDAFLTAKDVLKMMVDGHRLATDVNLEQVADVKMMLKSLSENGDVTPKTTSAVVAIKPELEPEPEIVILSDNNTPIADGLKRFNISFINCSEKDLTNLQSELELLGSVILGQATDKKPYLLLDTESDQDDILSICSFVLEPEDLVITLLDPTLEATIVAPAKTQVAQSLVSNSVVTEPVADSIKDEKPKTEKVKVEEEVGYGLFAEEGEENVEEGYGFFAPFKPHPDAQVLQLIGDDNASAALEDKKAEDAKVVTETITPTTMQPAAKRESPTSNASSETTSIRVGIEKVDQLINLVGELVITQAMIEQRISTLDPAHHEPLINSVGQLTRNTRDLQEAVMSIRMMPMDFVFSRFPRMVRDLAAKLNKKVEFVTNGATTELDKGLIERIVDPLTHLVRNSVDHGIETPEQRKKSGKNETGRLTLSAAHKGGSIVIEVTDDGAGLNRSKLLAKAKSSGLNVGESMTDTEVYQLIFAPGFSTAEVVTDVSGRGVGMDVVKRNIAAMGGVVEIRSVLGYGTTVSIALPLTLAILDGMSVSLGRSLYVIPLGLIVETMQPTMNDIKTVTGKGLMVSVRGEYLPIIPLYALFNQDTEIMHPTEGVLVILEAEGKKAALFVDGLVGQQQVVIKSLETNFKKVNGVSGATIMGDGSVALIIDVPAIIKMGQLNTEGAMQ
ncbi:MAG: chemotaxis protein CheW [Methylophilaceae bacterium]|nr:chemotaxis protein CheW [Methylophilaceae bacterium]